MASLIDHPQVAALLARIESNTRCAVSAPIVPDQDEVVGACGLPLPCPRHGLAVLYTLGFVDDETLRRLGSKPNIRQPEGPPVNDSISGAEDNTDIGAQADPQPETNVEVEVNNGTTEQAGPAQSDDAPDADAEGDDSE